MSGTPVHSLPEQGTSEEDTSPPCLLHNEKSWLLMEWKVGGPHAHLNVNTGDCHCVDIECPEKCGQHIEENTQKHLALMASASMKLSQVFEKKLQQ